MSDDDGHPVPHTLIEIWQTNAAGRYFHNKDNHPAPLDPNFTGAGRALTDANGCYRFVTIKPGAYPWRNHDNAWRPAHIHFSLFGPAFSTRLITQMYFPGDPLLAFDPIAQSIRDESARQRLIAQLRLADHRAGVGARLSLRHRAAWARCDSVRRLIWSPRLRKPSARSFTCASLATRRPDAWPASEAKGEHIRLNCRVLDSNGVPVNDAMIELWQADAAGVYNHPDDPRRAVHDPAFCGFGRLATDEQGRCVFNTVIPGGEAPHINVSVFARGLLKRVVTRIYFSVSEKDPVLELVPENRRDTLLARRDSNDPALWSFDIHLAGEHETVFFEI